ncbi:MAG: hypothetical protein H6577_17970 [Lewinellaceae bacterium]|nr:hypothetical protein [Saprospiraceae bacterium]MCB9340014.1 hypothetical protein [Lewinellaceae bacterium]
MIAVPTSSQERILTFLNRAQTLDDIINPAVLKDHKQNGSTIGEEAGKTILDIRKQLPLQRFMNFNQIEAIPGLGKDKLQDLGHSIAEPAADAFQERMYDGVLFNNFELTAYSTYFDDKAEFYDLAQSNCRFTEWVKNEVEDISLEKYDDPKAARLAGMLLEKCPLEIWDNPHYGAIAFAFWFYRFDADNWFSFERVREETERYLTYYAQIQHRLELRFFKTFENAGVLADAVTVPDLPVVVNYGEQELTIWTGQLYD